MYGGKRHVHSNCRDLSDLYFCKSNFNLFLFQYFLFRWASCFWLSSSLQGNRMCWIRTFEYLFCVISLIWVIQFMQICKGRFLNRGDLILVFHTVLTAFSLLEFHRLREQDLNSVLSCVLITELLNLNQSLLYLIHWKKWICTDVTEGIICPADMLMTYERENSVWLFTSQDTFAGLAIHSSLYMSNVLRLYGDS